MQISAPTKTETLSNIGSAALGAIGTCSYVAGVSGSIKAGKTVGKIAAKACGNPWGAVVCAAIAIVAVSAQQISADDNRGIAAGYCGDVSAGDDARRGCSVVRTVEYDIAEIENYCTVIESIP